MIMRAFASEWVKLRRRSLFATTYLALAAVAALLTVLVFNRAGRQRLRRGEAISLARLAQADGLTFALSRALPLLGVITLSVAAAQVASEYSQGTLRNLLVRQPRRVALLSGKYTAILTFTLGIVVVAAIASCATATGMAHARGVSTAAWTTSDGWRMNRQAIGDGLAAMVAYTLLGVALGTVIRSPVAAVVIGLAYLLPLETILAAIIPDAARWLPGQLLDSVARGGTTTVDFAPAVWTITAYLAGALVVAAAVFWRRDVTS